MCGKIVLIASNKYMGTVTVLKVFGLYYYRYKSTYKYIAREYADYIRGIVAVTYPDVVKAAETISRSEILEDWEIVYAGDYV